MFESKQFATTDFSRGSRLYKAVSQCLNDMHPDFALLVSQNHNRCFPEIGRVAGWQESESADKLLVTIQAIDIEGHDLDQTREEIVIMLNAGPIDLGVNTWCDDLAKVNSLCARKNEQHFLGLQNIVDKATEMQELIARTAGASMESMIKSPLKKELADTGSKASDSFKPRSRGVYAPKSTEKPEINMDFGKPAEEGMKGEK